MREPRKGEIPQDGQQQGAVPPPGLMGKGKEWCLKPSRTEARGPAVSSPQAPSVPPTGCSPLRRKGKGSPDYHPLACPTAQTPQCLCDVRSGGGAEMDLGAGGEESSEHPRRGRAGGTNNTRSQASERTSASLRSFHRTELHTLLLSLFDLINGTWIVGIHPDQYKRPAKTARAQRFNTD